MGLPRPRIHALGPRRRRWPSPSYSWETNPPPRRPAHRQPPPQTLSGDDSSDGCRALPHCLQPTHKLSAQWPLPYGLRGSLKAVPAGGPADLAARLLPPHPHILFKCCLGFASDPPPRHRLSDSLPLPHGHVGYLRSGCRRHGPLGPQPATCAKGPATSPLFPWALAVPPTCVQSIIHTPHRRGAVLFRVGRRTLIGPPDLPLWACPVSRPRVTASIYTWHGRRHLRVSSQG